MVCREILQHAVCWRQRNIESVEKQSSSFFRIINRVLVCLWIKLHNMLREQVERVEQVIADYYVSIGIEPDYTTRAREQVQSRAAIMCALEDSLTATDIGKLFGKDHATVLHHRKLHEGNLESWDGYTHKYEIARSMVNVNLRSKTVQSQINRIESEIKRLNESAEKLKKSIQLISENE